MGSYDRDPDAWPPRRRRWWLWTALAALVVAPLAFVGWRWAESRRTARMIEEIRARGEPTTWRELAARPPRPHPDEDATDLWLRASANLDDRETTGEGRFATVPIIGAETDQDVFDAETAALGAEFLEKHAADMAKLHEAAEMGGAAHYPVDYSAGLMTLLEFMADLRTAARALSVEANVRAHQGDAAGAVDSTAALAALANSLANEPLLVSQLVRIALDGMKDHEARRLAGNEALDDAQLARLQQVVGEADFRRGAREALLGERVMGVMTFDDPKQLGIPAAAAALHRLVYHQDMRTFIQHLTNMLDLVDEPWPEALERGSELDTEIGQLSHMHVFTKMLSPSTQAFMRAVARAEASQQLTILALALERYRRRHGRPPATLDALAPEFLDEVPLDPFVEKPFGYQLEDDDGYVVYGQYTDGGADETGVDPATGADNRMLFRWPPRAE